MNKKALAGMDQAQWVFRIFFLIIVVLSVTILVKSFIKNDVNIVDVEMDLMFKRMIYSPQGIVYVDESIGRPYPGIIDLQKFKNGANITDKIIDYGEQNNYIAAKLMLFEPGTKDEKYSFYYNRNGYFRWKPLVSIAGVGGVESATKKTFVQVYDSNTERFNEFILVVDLIAPRS